MSSSIRKEKQAIQYSAILPVCRYMWSKKRKNQELLNNMRLDTISYLQDNIT